MIIDMNQRSGFTIIELIIVMFVIGILLTLGVVNLKSTQIASRDSERRIDVDTIAIQLERYYSSGDNKGTYPSTALTTSQATMQDALDNIDIDSITAPNVELATMTFISATNATQTTAGVTPQPTVDQYVYQPIKTGGTLCTGTESCRKYNIYYRTEADNEIHLVTSKHQ